MKRNKLVSTLTVPISKLGLAAILLCVSPMAWAQFSVITDSTSTPIPGSGHDYIKMLSETVSPANGSVSLGIGIPLPTGRQMTVPFSTDYNSNGVLAGSGSPLYSSGWGYSVPMLTSTKVDTTLGIGPPCRAETGFVFTGGSDGAQHALGLANLLDPCIGQQPILTGGDDVVQAAIGGNGDVSVAEPDGTIYRFLGCIGTSFPKSIEDRNGNVINFSGDGATCNQSLGSNYGIFSVTDTLGRTVLSSSGFGHTGDTITVSGLATPYQLTWDVAPVLAFGLHHTYIGDPKLIGQPGGCQGDFTSIIGGGGFSNNVVSAITLPNQQQYQFTYDDHGLLSQITYPGGGFASYTWDVNSQSHYELLPNLPINGGSAGANCPYRSDSLAVSQRQVSFDGVTVAQEQDFAYSTTWSSDPNTLALWTGKQTVVTTHDLLNATKFKTFYTYAPAVSLPIQPYLFDFNGRIPVEKTIVYQDFSGAVLRTVNKTWLDSFELASETTTLDNGLTSEITYTYGPGAQVKEKDEFDYGQNGVPGPLLRKTVTSYASFSAPPLFPLPAILDHPAVNTVYDGNNRQVAQTVYCYDQTAPIATSAVTQHDYKHYSSTYSVRGNLTQGLRWLNPPSGQSPTPSCGQSTSSSALSTTFTYDDTGQRLSMTEPMGFETDYIYGFQNAYLTQVQTPVPNSPSTNPPHGTGKRLSTSADYDFNSGLLKSTTDVNQQPTTYSYNDPLNRVTLITRPDASKTTIQYNDTPPDLFVHILQDMDSSRSLESYSYVDGIGRPIRELQFDGTPTTPWIATETFYDGLGRAASISGPHRVDQPSATQTPCSAPIPCTATKYDALGRPTTVTAADGQSLTFSYAGNSTRVTDEAGLTKDMFDDGLGRLTQVTENPTNVNGDGSPVTAYSYDPLNNLVQITQGAQKRYFAYDSLSRRSRDFSPELGVNPNLNLSDPVTGNSQWSQAFAYDNNSNLTSHTDVAGRVTTNSYDQVNRIITTQYSVSTPQVDEFYDGTGAMASISNVLGRLNLVSSSVAKFSYDGYDSVGNVLGTTQTVDGLPYQVTYQYDLAGHLTSEKYPSQRVVKTGYDAAGRVSSLDSPSNTTNYVDQVQYAPHGAITSLLLGNGLWETLAYDPNRLQPTEIDVGATKGGNEQISLQYDYQNANGQNNGDVQRHWITAPGNFAVTQLAMYDGLDRLTRIQELSGANVPFPLQPSAIWEQDFTLDRWGNRTGMAAAPGLPTPPALGAPAIDQNTNRFVATSGYSYDGAGNLATEPVDAGSNSYTYDANNHLIQSQTSLGSASYSYDGLGHRVKKTVNGQTTVFAYDALGRLVAEYNPAVTPTNGTRYLTQDILDSTRLLTGTDPNSGAAVVVARYDYLPYGEIIPSGFGGRGQVGGYGPEGPVQQLFTGKEKDTETNLDYFLARYSSNEKGRFTSPDQPFAGWHLEDPQTLNLYAYVRNNPLNRIDILGHDSDDDDDDSMDDDDTGDEVREDCCLRNPANQEAQQQHKKKKKHHGKTPKPERVRHERIFITVETIKFPTCADCNRKRLFELPMTFTHTPEETKAFLDDCQLKATAAYNRAKNQFAIDSGQKAIDNAKTDMKNATLGAIVGTVIEKAVTGEFGFLGVLRGGAAGLGVNRISDAIGDNDMTEAARKYQEQYQRCQNQASLGLFR